MKLFPKHVLKTNLMFNLKTYKMKYLTYIILSLFLSINLCEAQKPQVVHSIIKEEKQHSFFVTQAELWWKEIEKNEKNEKAWLNYYKANRYL